MAAKKQKNNSINLLKGITGSKLAKLIAVLFILVAIPVTVLMSQNQQNVQQEAAAVSCPDKYGNTYGNCYNKTLYNCSTSWVKNLCPGSSSVQCCKGGTVTPKSATTTTKKGCAGRCEDVNLNTCSVSWKQGLCNGGTNIRCCTGTVKKVSQVPCKQYINPDNGQSGDCRTSCISVTTKGKCGTGLKCCALY